MMSDIRLMTTRSDHFREYIFILLATNSNKRSEDSYIGHDDFVFFCGKSL